MYARVRLTVDRRADALTVPRNAVVDIEGKRGVFLVESDDRAVPARCTTGLSDGDRIEVLDGLDRRHSASSRRARWRCATAIA